MIYMIGMRLFFSKYLKMKVKNVIFISYTQRSKRSTCAITKIFSSNSLQYHYCHTFYTILNLYFVYIFFQRVCVRELCFSKMMHIASGGHFIQIIQVPVV